MDTIVREAPSRSRYELLLGDDLIGVIDYHLDGTVVALTHTEVVPHLRGRGYGARLVQGALDDLRSRGRQVLPACEFVQSYIDRNEAYADLVA